MSVTRTDCILTCLQAVPCTLTCLQAVPDLTDSKVFHTWLLTVTESALTSHH